jgi:hypothetical protein
VDEHKLNRRIGQPTFPFTACEAAGTVPQLARVADPFGASVVYGRGFDSITAKHDLSEEIAASVRPVLRSHVGD